MFKMIHDLSTLSEADRARYCRDFASYLGLNPDENRIDTIWMQDNSVRSLVAYCRRGTTDILRDVHNIDVTEMIKEDGPGYVSFKAFGINRRGRKEIAVGAFATAGLSGDKLAAAVATAETRAGRRLTLKFMGGGLLDESEVNRDPVQIPSSPVAAPPVQPEVKPNEQVGTETKVEYRVQLPSYVGLTAVGIPPKPLSEPAPAPQMAVPASVEAANAILAKDVPSEPIKKKRGRKSKNTVDMGDQPVPVPNSGTIVPISGTIVPIPVTPAPAEPTGQQLTYVPICPDCQDFMSADDRLDMYLCVKHGRVDTAMKPSVVRNVALAPVAPPPAPVPVAPPPVPQSLLTPDQQKSVKTRLSTFWVYILPEQGGMTSDDGLSINGKLMKYADQHYSDAPNHKNWNFDQWASFITSIEKYNTEFGPKALVEHINTKIGVA